MRFIPAEKARALKVGEKCFVELSDGSSSEAKLFSRSETVKGTVLKFELPQYFNPDAPAVKPLYTEDVVKVCRIREKEEEA